MGISYLPNKKRWSEITRDERYFCSELHNVLQESDEMMDRFIDLINKTFQATNGSLPKSSSWTIGYEVCFYRDVMYERAKSIKDYQFKPKHVYKNHKGREIDLNVFPPKRTFDLCLFHPEFLVIVEAKAAEGFKNKQLDDFRADKVLIQKEAQILFENGVSPKVIFVGLHSSNYTPSFETLQVFEDEKYNPSRKTLCWSELSKEFPKKSRVFNRANSIYPSKPRK